MTGPVGAISVRAATDADEVRRCHADLLTDAFTPDELVGGRELVQAWREGSSDVVVALDGQAMVGAAVAEVYPEARTVLMAWLAVAATDRRHGVGSIVHGYAVDRWRRLFHPSLVLAEVEHPHVARSSPAHGDPRARLRFYARHGAKALDLPYFQPPVRPGAPRVYGLVLIVLASAAEIADGLTIAASPVRRFLRAYLPVADDPADTALRSAASGARIDLLDLRDPDRLPISAAPRTC